MKVTISFKHLEHTEALDEKIKEKTARLNKYLEGNTEVHWMCYVEEGLHYADIQIHGPSFHYKAHAESKSMYKTFDLALTKLERQLLKKKTKWKNRMHRRPESENLAFMTDPDAMWDQHDEEIYDDVGP